MATFNGTNGADTYNGTSADDQIYGNGGKDTLNGNSGGDLIEGGSGADLLDGGDGDDTLVSYQADFSYQGAGSLDVSAEHDTLIGGVGDDRIAAGYGDAVDGGTNGAFGDYLYINFLGASHGVHADFTAMYTDGFVTIGGATITGIEGTPVIQGSNYDDYIRGISNPYTPFTVVHGNGGNDDIKADYYSAAIYGDDGDDTLDVTDSPYGPDAHGGNGNDTLYGGYNAPSLFGDAGDDLIYNSGLSDGGSGNDVIHSSFSYYDNRAFGGDGDDTIDATGGADNQFYGGAGADSMDAEQGNDTLYSDGDGPDRLDTGLEQDSLLAGTGDDVLSIGYGDNADGGDGVDTITMVWDPAAVGLKLKTGSVINKAFQFGGGSVQNVERIDSLYLTDSDDTVRVTPQYGTVTIYGNGGNDHLFGLGSAVHLLGGEGDDRLVAGAGGDTLDGGAGDDLFLINGAGEDAVEGSDQGSDEVRSSVSFTLGDNIEQLTLTGNGASDGTGNDLANTIVGNAASNTLSGLDGDDKLIGGAGRDTLTGGADADHFEFWAVSDFAGRAAVNADSITDFDSIAGDLIALTRIDAIAGGADDPFSFIGTNGFTGHAGELRYKDNGVDTFVTGDLDGDATADFLIVLNGVHTLSATDFLL